MEKQNELIIHTDGGARGNPGPAAIGVEIKTIDNKILGQISQTIGEATNNEAEYLAVIAAYKFLLANNINSQKINLYLDSQLIYHQLQGRYKVKSSHLKKLFVETKTLERQLNCSIKYQLVPREQNREADLLVNRAMDVY